MKENEQMKQETIDTVKGSEKDVSSHKQSILELKLQIADFEG
mgnify:CR=1 FL=1